MLSKQNKANIKAPTQRVWCRLQRFVRLLRELWYTYQTKKFRGTLTIWEYHIFRLYRKYVQSRVNGYDENEMLSKPPGKRLYCQGCELLKDKKVAS